MRTLLALSLSLFATLAVTGCDLTAAGGDNELLDVAQAPIDGCGLICEGTNTGLKWRYYNHCSNGSQCPAIILLAPRDGVSCSEAFEGALEALDCVER